MAVSASLCRWPAPPGCASARGPAIAFAFSRERDLASPWPALHAPLDPAPLAAAALCTRRGRSRAAGKARALSRSGAAAAARGCSEQRRVRPPAAPPALGTAVPREAPCSAKRLFRRPCFVLCLRWFCRSPPLAPLHRQPRLRGTPCPP